MLHGLMGENDRLCGARVANDAFRNQTQMNPNRAVIRKFCENIAARYF